jgi:hypothetical protein
MVSWPSCMRRRLGVIAMSLLTCVQVYGHRPVEADQAPDRFDRALWIERPEVSQVYYAALSVQRPEVWFRFEGKEGEEIYFSVGVPVLDRLKDFRPRAALIGPGLGSGSGSRPADDMPFELPPAEKPGSARTGVEVYSARGEPRFFHEPFTGTDSWILLEVTRRLPQAGLYYLVAYTLENPKAGDKLWLSMGTRERFTLADLFTFRRWKRDIRRFHELP